MEPTVFKKLLTLILQNSFSTTVKRSNSHTQFSGKSTLSDSEMDFFLNKLAIINGTSPDKTLEEFNRIKSAAFEKKIKHRGIWFLPIILILGIAISAIIMKSISFLAFWLALFCFGCLIVYIKNSKNRKVLKIWKNRPDNPNALNDTVNEMAEVYKNTALSACNPLIIIALIGAIAVAFYCVTALAPDPIVRDPVYKELSLKLESADSESEFETLLALTDEKTLEETEKIVTMLQQDAQENSTYGKRFAIAIFADTLLAENKITEETAEIVIADMLSSFSSAIISNQFESEAFIKLLEHTDLALTEKLLDGVLSKRGENEFLTSCLGDYYGKKMSLDDIIFVYNQMENKGVFLESVLKYVDIKDILNNYSMIQETEDLLAYIQKNMKSEVQELLKELPDDESRKELLIYLAPGYQIPDEVLSYIRLAKEYGVTPTECYPNGAKLDWDLTHLNIYDFADTLSDDGKLLILRRTEKKEELEYKTVPRSDYTLGDDFVSLYDEIYESNFALGKDAFDVFLDTEALEMMPENMIPYQISELDTILLLDTLYVRDGTIQDTDYKYEIGKSTALTDISQITSQKHYPAYSVIQSIAIYNLHSGLTEYIFNANVIYRPDHSYSAPQVNYFSSGLYVDHSIYYGNDISTLYCAVPDNEWMEAQRSEILSLLEASEWSVFIAELTHYMENGN